MAMKDMKCSKSDTEEYPTNVGMSAGSRYPYGLRLTLENDGLKKLGMDKLPKVGAKIYIEAMGVVESVRQNSSAKGEEYRCVEIQLQKIGLDDSPSSMEDAIDEGIDDAE
jgi:hypothetical protein